MNDSYYEDNYFSDDSGSSQEETQSAEQSQSQFDPSKFVPIEQYQQLETKINDIQPQLETVNRIQQAFDPSAALSPEQREAQRVEQAALEKVQGLIDQKLAPLQQQAIQREEAELNSWSTTRGFQNANEAELWLHGVQMNLAGSQDPNSQQLAQELAANWNHGLNTGSYIGVKNFVERNWDRINNSTGVAGTMWAKTSPVKSQTIGQSFSNQPFQANSDISSQIEAARRAGNMQEVSRLRQEWSQSIAGGGY